MTKLQKIQRVEILTGDLSGLKGTILKASKRGKDVRATVAKFKSLNDERLALMTELKMTPRA